MPPPSRLPIACTLSVLLHLLVLLAWPLGPIPPGEPQAYRPLQATLTAERPRPGTGATREGEAMPETAPALPQPESPPLQDIPREAAAAAQPEAASPPAYFPFSALSRPPELLTEVGPGDWPPTPGAPPGQVAMEVDIGTDGRVMRVTPLCEPKLCEAAGIYGGFILGWRFRPAEIDDKAVPSRIRVEVEISDISASGLHATPVPQTQPAPRQ